MDPDEAFSPVPYEKGSTFLWYLEDVVGEPSKMEAFLRFYFKNFAFKSIDSNDFQSLFMTYFNDNESVKDIDWNAWLHDPGMPIWKPDFDDSLAKASRELARKWQEWNPETKADFGDAFENFTPWQVREFLGALLDGEPLENFKMEKMSELYKLDQSPNTEILCLWIRLGLKAKWEPSVPKAINLVNVQGRMKYVLPIYRDLYNWTNTGTRNQTNKTDIRQLAIDNFIAHGDKLMFVAREKVKKILNLDQ